MSEPITLRVFGSVGIPYDLSRPDALLGCPCPICGDLRPCSCTKD